MNEPLNDCQFESMSKVAEVMIQLTAAMRVNKAKGPWSKKIAADFLDFHKETFRNNTPENFDQQTYQEVLKDLWSFRTIIPALVNDNVFIETNYGLDEVVQKFVFTIEQEFGHAN